MIFMACFRCLLQVPCARFSVCCFSCSVVFIPPLTSWSIIDLGLVLAMAVRSKHRSTMGHPSSSSLLSYSTKDSGQKSSLHYTNLRIFEYSVTISARTQSISIKVSLDLYPLLQVVTFWFPQVKVTLKSPEKVMAMGPNEVTTSLRTWYVWMLFYTWLGFSSFTDFRKLPTTHDER